MREKIGNIIRKYGWVALVITFFIGWGGYVCEGAGILEAVYATGALFFVNPSMEEVNFAIMLSKLVTLIVAAGFIVKLVDSLGLFFWRLWAQRWPDSTAVYSDNEWGKQLSKKLKHGFSGRTEDGGHPEQVHCHMIMFSDDMDNLKFFRKHYESMKDDEVYIMLNRIDSFLMGKANQISAKVHFFNLYDLMARRYWRRFDLYDQVKAAGEGAVRVAIVGYGPAGQSICKYALLNNLYRPNQSIEYHIFGCQKHHADFLTGISMMNGDRIVIHPESPFESAGLLGNMDRVILASDQNIELLQFLLHHTQKPKIHYYDGESVIEQVFATDRLHVFGDMEGILNEECIKRETLFRMGKLINYDYDLGQKIRKQEEEEPQQMTPALEADLELSWSGLDGFLRGSNIARADHYWIEKKLKAEECADEQICELEHIRWCRYHFYNHWSWADIPKKDKIKRLHPDLLPFAQLRPEERKKDEMHVRVLIDEMDKLADRF